MKSQMDRDLTKSKDMGEVYDRDARAFAEKASQLLTWTHIGSRALDKYLKDFYGRKDIKVLDQGSASGRVVQHLIDHGIPAENITGVEISGDEVAIARKRIPEATFIKGNLTEVDLPPNSFDLVTRHMVDEHFDNKVLLEVSKKTLEALKPGGTAVVVFTHPDKITTSAGVTEEGWFETTFPWGGKGQNYFRPVESYTKVLEEAGFIIDVVEGWKIPPDAEEINAEEYAKYKKYGNVRLGVVAHKPLE